MSKKPILLSGIQPSGHLMIGNYIGALKNWVSLQNDYDCLFSIVDMHSITVKQDPDVLRQHCYDVLAIYLACGIDPKKNIIFVQSHVPAHAELAWVLNCFTGMGELKRMTQFKDKSKRYADNVNAGLFAYPTLMAADILLYQANLVPVGHDQKQHLELTRDLALRFNKQYGELFTVPEPYIPPPMAGGRIMSLQDPTKKMSKSDANASNYIALLDPPATIIKKVKRAVTDSGSDIHHHKSKPGISNLLTLYAAISDKTMPQLEKEYVGSGYGQFKSDLGEAVAAFLAPLQQRFHELRSDTAALNEVIQHGARAAQLRAEKTLHAVYDVIGFIPKQK